MTVVAVSLPAADKVRWWTDALRDLLPGWRVEPMGEAADRDAVRYAVVWRPAPGAIARHPALRAVVSIGAGIDHVLADPQLPAHLPIIRTTGADLTQRMREYVALHVLRHHRDMPRQLRAQRERDWHAIVVPPAPHRVVGVMGLGNLGLAAARTLASLGFRTRGWARAAREVEGVETFAGEAGLGPFLDGCEILVCLLPLTDATRGILDAALLARLPEGACLVNCARGGHLAEDDLLAALASGRIKQATLDVFAQEPLPAAHPFWDHPQVTVTPHVASQIDAGTGARLVAANLQAFERTGTCDDLADRARGY